MNNNQRFDEHIKEQFGNYSPDVHPRIWENIAAQKEKRRPAGFWFTFLNSKKTLVILGLLLVGGSSALLLIKNPAGVSDHNTILQKTNASSNKTPVAVIDDKNVTTTENTTSLPVPTITNNNISASSLPVNSTIVNSSPLSNLRSQSPFFKSVVQDGPIAFNKKQGNTKGKFSVKTTDGTLIENEENGFSAGLLPPGGTLLNRLAYGAQKIAAAKKSSGSLLVPDPPFGFLPDCPSLEKNASGNKKYFEFYAGPDFALRSFRDTGNSVYMQKRKESTKFTSAYSAGVRFTRVFKNSISVRGGINYSQINEKFTYVQGNLVQVTYIINANGDTTGSYVTTGTRYKTTHNKYRSIDVPLSIGYEVGNGRLHANINAGVVINVYSWQKGEVLDTSYQPVNITTGKGSSPYQFKTNAGLGFIGAVSVYYKVNDKIHILAEPYFRYNLSQINKENLTLKQKYNTIGLRVGVRVDLH